MNTKVLTTLEYDKIKQQVAQYLVTPAGKKLLANLYPSSNYQQVQLDLNRTQDAADILRLKGGIPLPKLADVHLQLKRLKINAALNGKELAEIAKVLRSAAEVKSFFSQLAIEEVNLHSLNALANQLQVFPQLTKQLLRSLEEDGHLSDDASVKLAAIRRSMSQLRLQLRSQLNALIRGKSAKYLTEPVITIRDDRYVIPVKQEYRGHFGGVVHDQSASGQTLFVEPAAALDLNNRLRQRQANEREEIQRILTALSASLAPYVKEIAANAALLGEFDFANAKAKYAQQLKATYPRLSVDNQVYLRQAWHPLLNEKKVVRNDIMLGQDYQTMVITGPNTGGKTITLKTLGLIQLMGQSGLFIPAFEDSQIGVFKEIFADIGDEQSIEQNLSTFSAHLTNIVEILNNCDQSSLVLLDELGAGTDPQEGAALAVAILDALAALGSYVVATTHYPELKAYGYERLSTINASMEFDSQTLQPTYRLLIGIPGQSNAFAISQRLGLSAEIIAAARQLTSNQSQDLNQMIQDLVRKRQQAEEERARLAKYLTEGQELHHDLQVAFNKFEKQKAHLLEQAKLHANQIIDQASQRSDELISELRQMKLNANASVKEDQLITAKTKMNELHQPLLSKNRVLRKVKLNQQLKPGDDVLVKPYDQQGTLLEKTGKHEWEVQLGSLKMKIAEGNLEKIKIKPEKVRIRSSFKSSSQVHVSPVLDLRGQRYETAMTMVDRYLDSALLAGYASVTIIHGKGTGALREGIRQYLQTNRRVKSFGFAPANAGGDGATIVELK
ncbi:endonuclease MutS2 [Liquorilactobacillus vini]|uniref:Endonuclease MutS2 n=1 Tax=Liquorilactobacillus vini DSM 20605 TaxID=1133569 RepID=A0A0R2CC18_9LACO|nr:endonuclease MutS2 [Liquorilactobacillus vini]KRM88906.1 DNA mismatch repair protein [Liquorilactobacillus vini DSM 20605]